MTAWKNDFIDINLYARSGKKITGVKKLVLHYTANPGGSAANHKIYFGTTLPVINKQLLKEGKKPRYASAHIFVDSKEAICILPLSEVAYHANDVQKRDAKGNAYRGVKELLPNANLLSIGVEMCVEKDGSISPTTIQRTVDVFVELCKTFNLSEEDIVRHFDVTKKNCPAPFVKDESLFEDFTKQVGLKLNSSNVQSKPVSTTPTKPKTYLEKGDKGDSVKNLQTLLEKLGYDAGSIDGIFGNATDVQVRKFQKDNKLSVDGLAGNSTMEILKEKVELISPTPKPVEQPKPTQSKPAPAKPVTPSPVKKVVNYPGHVVQKGSKDTASIKLIQQKLGIKADGIFGDNTDKKVKEFQKKNKLAADGDVGKLTWNKLFN